MKLIQCHYCVTSTRVNQSDILDTILMQILKSKRLSDRYYTEFLMSYEFESTDKVRIQDSRDWDEPEPQNIVHLEIGMRLVIWAVNRGVNIYRLENPDNKKEFAYIAGHIHDIMYAFWKQGPKWEDVPNKDIPTDSPLVLRLKKQPKWMAEKDGAWEWELLYFGNNKWEMTIANGNTTTPSKARKAARPRADKWYNIYNEVMTGPDTTADPMMMQSYLESLKAK